MILAIHALAAGVLIACTVVLVIEGPRCRWAGAWWGYGLSTLWFGLHALANLEAFWAALCITIGLLTCARADHLSHNPERNTP